MYQNEGNVVVKRTKDEIIESIQKKAVLREKQNSLPMERQPLVFSTCLFITLLVCLCVDIVICIYKLQGNIDLILEYRQYRKCFPVLMQIIH